MNLATPRTVAIKATPIDTEVKATVIDTEVFIRRPGEVRRARAWIGKVLAPEVASETLDDIRTCLSECVTNAAVHANAGTLVGVIVMWTAPDMVRVEVIDQGNTEQKKPHIPATLQEYASGGRGLNLVATLSSKWGCQKEGDGTGWVVWFQVADQQSCLIESS
ncbi:ATP-binding protein [Actinomadura sp. NEAU-AAG7]|uniref:ATP-binding protein n=1 Tax=Actinomadura sp. NEAU-AAG7 TaxID=2839640 RepID=UPI001BE432DB|nr:ATP-binding protein [Actinomadura sp. NEAU-AAG7]MBT2213447.1 ATP-binding protein [Actinomadura sp. NEAU-AAG7]